MDLGTILIILVVSVAILFAGYRLVLEEQIYLDSLPTLEEAKILVGEKYPEYRDYFQVTKRADSLYLGHWAGSIVTHTYFLTCKEIGVSIRISSKDVSE